ncbi:MAG TPA: ABC transporter permease subunit [Halobacteriales archaeon]|nr:ABC transporter permease subunit [Halobacteriales archaeon]
MSADSAESGGGHPTNVEAGVDTETGSGRWTVLEQTAVLARHEFRLSVRNAWAFALTGLFALFAVLLSLFSGARVGPSGFDAIVVSLASLATYLLPLAGLVFGYDTIVGADEDGHLDSLFALPVARSTVVFGKYVGRAFTLGAATVIGFGAAGVVLLLYVGLLDWPIFTGFVVMSVGLALTFLAVGVLISTLAEEKTHALGLVLLVWVSYVLVYDLIALGMIATFDLPPAVLSLLVLANPADVFRVFVLSGVDTTGGGFAAVYAGTGLSVPLLVVTLVLWNVVPVLLAARAVRRRSV